LKCETVLRHNLPVKAAAYMEWITPDKDNP
jgi:hypothetical protein